MARFYFNAQAIPSHTRARQLHHREPDTLRWIESFEPGSVFWDIGSNIGVFSLYAAHVPGVRVVAFDPLADNFSTLNRNVTLNGLHDKVMVFCAAISAETKVVAAICSGGRGHGGRRRRHLRREKKSL